jgi:hypothetical protein
VTTRRNVRVPARALDVVLVAAATAYACRMVRRAPSWTVDDAWIVARYADNLAQHGHLAWNLDGPPVEGFTSLSAVLVAALASALHVAPMKALYAMGVLGLLASGFLLLGVGRALRSPPGAAGIVAVVHMTMAEHLTHATSGLETEVFLALGLALVWTLALALRSKTRSVAPVAVLGLLLTTTRPEGIVPAALALAVLLVPRRRDGATRVVAAATWFVLPCILLLAWRFHSFGALVPNTWFAKRAGWNGFHHRDLVALVEAHFVDPLVAAAACVMVARVFLRGPPVVWRRDRAVAFVAGVTLLAQSVAYARSEPLMDYARRFAVHDLPWLSVLALIAVSAALRALRRLPRSLAWALAGILVLATTSAAVRGAAGVPNEVLRTTIYARCSREMVEPLAAWIETHTAPDATLAVYPDAGFVPYATRRRTIDFGKLNDTYLARFARSPADVAGYFFENHPDVLVVSQPHVGKLWDSGADAIVADPRFRSGYELAMKQEGAGGIGYFLYARRAP